MKGSYSKSTCIKRCMRKAYYRYVMELRRKKKALTLEKGSLIHACLEAYYQNPSDLSKVTGVLQQYINETWNTLMDEEKAAYGDLPQDVYRVVVGYIRAYREHDKNMKVLGTEIPFNIPLLGGHTLEGYIDLVVQDDNGVWVVDHKTVKQVPDENLRHTDVQLLIYTHVLKELGHPVTGAMINYIKSKPPQMPSMLQSGKGMSRTAIDTDWNTYQRALINAGLNPSDYEDMRDKLSKKVFFKRTRVPAQAFTAKTLLEDVGKTLDLWENAVEQEWFTRTMTRDCTWDCEYCPICFAQLSGVDAEHIIEDEYEKGVKKDGNESDQQEAESDFE